MEAPQISLRPVMGEVERLGFAVERAKQMGPVVWRVWSVTEWRVKDIDIVPDKMYKSTLDSGPHVSTE